jgi:ribosomal protein S21
MKKKPVHVEVTRMPGEAVERMIRRFSNKVKKERIIEEVRDRRYYESPSERRSREKARRRKVLRRLKEKQP